MDRPNGTGCMDYKADGSRFRRAQKFNENRPREFIFEVDKRVASAAHPDLLEEIPPSKVGLQQEMPKLNSQTERRIRPPFLS